MNDDLMSRLEKTAAFPLAGARKAVGKYIKNVTNMGVNKAQKNLQDVNRLAPMNDGLQNLAKKELHNAKVDRNITRAGTAAVGVAGGAGLGGYTAYQKSKEPVVDDIMTQNQVTQLDQQKVANEELMERLEKTAGKSNEEVIVNTDTLIDRLEKTAADALNNLDQTNPEYQQRMQDKRIMQMATDLYDKDPSYLESALQQEGLIDRAVENGYFKDPTPGQGAAFGGVLGGFAGGLSGALAPALGGEDLKTIGKWGLGGSLAGAGIVGGVGALEGLYRKKHPSDLHLKYHGGQTAPDVSPAHQEDNPRQGAGSVSNAPAGADKTASELMERLEKTASEWREDGAAGADLGARIGGGMGAVAGGISGVGAGAMSGGPARAIGGGLLGAAGGGLLGAGLGAGAFGLNGLLYGGAKDVVGYDAPEDGSNVGSTALAGAGSIGLMSGIGAAKRGVGLKGIASGVAGGGLNGGLVGAAIGGMRDHREEKTASEDDLMARLEKTAGVGNVANSLKGYANNVTGKNYREAKKTLDVWNTPEALKANAPKIGVSNFRNKLEGLESAKNTAKADMKKAQKGTAIAGAGAAGVAGAAGIAAASKAKSENEQTKTASVEDDVLTGLFKEAAAAIIDEKLPEVKQHIDPMSRIKF